MAGCQGLELGRMPEALDLAQPARQRVPTRENLGHGTTRTYVCRCAFLAYGVDPPVNIRRHEAQDCSQ